MLLDSRLYCFEFSQMLLHESLELIFMVTFELLADEFYLRQFDLFIFQLLLEFLILLDLNGEYQEDKRVAILICKLLSVSLELRVSVFHNILI